MNESWGDLDEGQKEYLQLKEIVETKKCSLQELHKELYGYNEGSCWFDVAYKSIVATIKQVSGKFVLMDKYNVYSEDGGRKLRGKKA